MSGKFEIYKDRSGKFRFRLKASNGQNILASEGYKAKSGCTNGIESVKKNARNDRFYIREGTKAGRFLFYLKAGNHFVIGTSQSYASAKARDNGIASVKKHAPEAKIEDTTNSGGPRRRA